MYIHHFNTSAVHIWLYYALHNNHDIFYSSLTANLNPSEPAFSLETRT